MHVLVVDQAETPIGWTRYGKHALMLALRKLPGYLLQHLLSFWIVSNT